MHDNIINTPHLNHLELTDSTIELLIETLGYQIQEHLREIHLSSANRGLRVDIEVHKQLSNRSDSTNVTQNNFYLRIQTHGVSLERLSANSSNKYVGMATVIKNEIALDSYESQYRDTEKKLPTLTKQLKLEDIELTIRFIETSNEIKRLAPLNNISSADSLITEKVLTPVLEDTFSIRNQSRKKLIQLKTQSKDSHRIVDMREKQSRVMMLDDSHVGACILDFFNQLFEELPQVITRIKNNYEIDDESPDWSLAQENHLRANTFNTKIYEPDELDDDHYEEEEEEEHRSIHATSILSLLLQESRKKRNHYETTYPTANDSLSNGISVNTPSETTSISSCQPVELRSAQEDHTLRFNPNYEYYPEDFNAILTAEIDCSQLGKKGQLVRNIFPANFQDIPTLIKNIKGNFKLIESELTAEIPNYTAIWPININTNHWVGCIVDVEPEKKKARFRYIDTLSGQTPDKITTLRDQLQRILGEEYSLEFLDSTIIHQKDVISCGPYFITHAMHYAYGTPLSTEALTNARQRHVSLLGNGFSEKQFKKDDSFIDFKSIREKTQRNQEDVIEKSKQLRAAIQKLNISTQKKVMDFCQTQASEMDSSESYQACRDFLKNLYDLEMTSNSDLETPIEEAELLKNFLNFLKHLFDDVRDNTDRSTLYEIVQHNKFKGDIQNILEKTAQLKPKKVTFSAGDTAANQEIIVNSKEILPEKSVLSAFVDDPAYIQAWLIQWREIFESDENAQRLRWDGNTMEANLLFLQTDSQLQSFYQLPLDSIHQILTQLMADAGLRFSLNNASSLLFSQILKTPSLTPVNHSGRKTILETIFNTLLRGYKYSEVLIDYLTCSSEDASVKFPKTYNLKNPYQSISNDHAQNPEEHLRAVLRLLHGFSVIRDLNRITQFVFDPRFNWAMFVSEYIEINVLIGAILLKESDDMQSLFVADGCSQILYDSYTVFCQKKEAEYVHSSPIFNNQPKAVVQQAEPQAQGQSLLVSIDKLHNDTREIIMTFIRDYRSTPRPLADDSLSKQLRTVASEILDLEVALNLTDDSPESEEALKNRLQELLNHFFENMHQNLSLKQMKDCIISTNLVKGLDKILFVIDEPNSNHATRKGF